MSEPRDQSADGVEQETFDEETILVTEHSTGHRKYEVPVSDVDRESVSLENAELVEERVHGDPTHYTRRDTDDEVDRRD